MNIFGKKKQRTQKQVRIRFWIAAGVVALMVIVCLLPSGKKRAADGDDVLETMDAQLQSLLTSDGRFPSGTTMEGAEAPQLIEEPDGSQAVLDDVRHQINLYTSMEEDGMALPEGTLERLRHQADSLEEAVAGKGPVQYYVRRIKAVLPDGREMTGFQKTKKDLSYSELTKLVEKPQPNEDLNGKMEHMLDYKQQFD